MKPDRILLTNTHVIALYRYLYSHMIPTTLIQVFTLPLDGSPTKNGKGVLRLTYEGVSDHLFRYPAILRDCIVDSITGATKVKLLETLDFNQCLNVTWGDLTLPEPAGNDVLPMTLVINEKIRKDEKLEYDRSPLIDCSNDGYVMGICRKYGPKTCPFMKFTIDATQEECTLSIGEFLPPEWEHIEDPPYSSWTPISFDASGWLWFVKSRDDQQAAVIVVDIQ